MFREIVDVIKGDLHWKKLKKSERIDYSKVVVVLTGENAEVDEYALIYLDELIRRKVAGEALILTHSEKIADKARQCNYITYPYKVKIVKEKIIYLIYKRYCIGKFFKNLFFTYTDKSKNNLLGRFIRETDINAEDVVCLAIYNLRMIPRKR